MHDAKWFRTIEILGSLMEYEVPPGTRVGGGDAVIERCVSSVKVRAEIDAAERDGVRALLLVIEGEGGNCDAGMSLYYRIRAFSDAGGRVVAFVRGRCASTLPIVVQAADLVLMRADAKLIVLGANAPRGYDVAEVNEAAAEILAERTGMAIEKLRVYCSDPEVCCQMHDLGSVRLGWADFAPVTLEEARSFARLLGQGAQLQHFDTPRIRRLTGVVAIGKTSVTGNTGWTAK